ncbi:hypothetical protein E2C01_053727 [Portunus trituberculatus]|uniref:Uncharacterized protein n=1 Tax=Portunus trituberculatus TaxID=210409 RepID=A0A5B7GRK8_PORTR|nr:hypothetical protein [Portunus trituberculatus]
MNCWFTLSQYARKRCEPFGVLGSPCMTTASQDWFGTSPLFPSPNGGLAFAITTGPPAAARSSDASVCCLGNERRPRPLTYHPPPVARLLVAPGVELSSS